MEQSKSNSTKKRSTFNNSDVFLKNKHHRKKIKAKKRIDDDIKYNKWQ
jgi:hypothetical protein